MAWISSAPFFKPASASDPGIMCSNMNVSNDINARKDYVEVETDAFIRTAAMNNFGMESLEDDVIPRDILHSQK